MENWVLQITVFYLFTSNTAKVTRAIALNICFNLLTPNTMFVLIREYLAYWHYNSEIKFSRVAVNTPAQQTNKLIHNHSRKAILPRTVKYPPLHLSFLQKNSHSRNTILSTGCIIKTLRDNRAHSAGSSELANG